ncbi:cadherin-like protein 26 [Oryzias latipes]|uniref:cadherin-like protein 26 n=1 Tax=Oryzias latipes TaxID=8090 RepID=UPI000CE26AD7|nr:cadherin-like protein 26 [Oryzias latipes]
MYNNKVEGKEFRFEISGEAVDLGYLTINETSGDVYVNKRIDREIINVPFFHVVFDVYDTETAQKIDKELAFNVVIKDINDNPPKFTEIPEAVTVDENQEEGLLEVQVIAQDMDERNTINSRFNISVIAQHPPEPKIQTKWIDERIVHLNFTGCFNYEKENKYSVTLQAKDHGDPPLSSTAEITINIVDRNTNMPVFKEREYQTKASEMETHDDLLRLAVEDKDTPNTDGWRAKYFFISGNEEDIFKLETDPITNEGILSIIKEKNYEKNSWVDLQVGVENIEPFSKCENGKLIKQGSKLYPPDSVSVKVLMVDSNDPPEFQKTKVDLFEKEESEPGKVLFTPEVHDPDSTSFRFVLVEDPANWVSVDEKTGEIRATKKMDRESPFVDADNVYKVVIAAIDDGDPPASSSCTISIHLRDTNDHKPQLVNNSIIMCGNMSNKMMLSVIDLDADPYSGPFHFSLDNDDNKKQWKLDPYYGQQGGLINLKPLSYGNYSISLVIEDQQNNIGRETLEVVVCDCENNTCHVKKALSFHLGVPAIYSMIAGLLLFLILLIGFSCSCKKHQFEQTEDKGYQTLVKYNREGHLLKPIAPTELTGPNAINQTNNTVKSATSSGRSLNKKTYSSGAYSMGTSDSLKESMVKNKTEMSINKPNLGGSHVSRSMNQSEQDPFSRVQSNIPLPDQIKKMTSGNTHPRPNLGGSHASRSMRSEMPSEFYHNNDTYRSEHNMNKSIDHYSSVHSDLQSDYNLSAQVKREIAAILEPDKVD